MEIIIVIMVITAIVLAGYGFNLLIKKIKRDSNSSLSKELNKKTIVIFLVIYLIAVCVLLAWATIYSNEGAKNLSSAAIIIIIPVILALFAKSKKTNIADNKTAINNKTSKFCGNCGMERSDDNKFCGNCGKKI